MKKRGVNSPGVDSVRNLRGTKIVKPVSSSNSTRGAKSPKSPKRATAKLVRTASEDDGTAVYPSPAHSAAFLLHSSENETSWRQYRVRKKNCYFKRLQQTNKMISMKRVEGVPFQQEI